MAISASGAYSLLGINADSISTMQEAIRTYKANIDDPLSQLSAIVDYAAGFKGSSIADSLKTYLERVIAEMQKMTAYIDEFDRSLDTVAANYASQAESVSSTVATDADAVEGKEVQTTTGVAGFGGAAGGGGAAGAGGAGAGAATVAMQ